MIVSESALKSIFAEQGINMQTAVAHLVLSLYVLRKTAPRKGQHVSFVFSQAKAVFPVISDLERGYDVLVAWLWCQRVGGNDWSAQ